MMLRSAIALVLVVASTNSLAARDAASPTEVAAALRPKATVSGDMVALGDLFLGVGEKANIPVAYAPEPGRRAVFDARWLYRVARAHGVTWRPASRHVQSVVTRDSVVIGRQEIEAKVLSALAEVGVNARNTRVELGNRHLRLHLPASPASELVVEDIVYDRHRGSFDAVLLASADGTELRRLRATGRVRMMTDVPILTRRVGRGETISANDIEWIAVQTRNLPRNVVLSADALVGKTPRRGLRAGAPIRLSDIQRRMLVGRGDLVTVELKTPRMRLTARGRALEEGGRGDTIRVGNVESGELFEALVTGPGRATVTQRVAGRAD